MKKGSFIVCKAPGRFIFTSLPLKCFLEENLFFFSKKAVPTMIAKNKKENIDK